MKLHRIVVSATLVWAACIAHRAAPATELIEQTKLDALAKPLVDGGWMNGIAIGLISDRGTQVVGYGRVSEHNAAAPAADTEFEIGSISKVFTGLLLAQMVEDRQVALDEPVQRLVGDSMTIPKGEREITLVDLATHSSGLPRMPGNFLPKNPNNPYADYSVEQMAKFLSGHKLRRQPGAQAEYSNLGMGLLGHALALKSGMTYEELLRKRICDPLGMNDTRIELDAGQTARWAQGHDCDGNPVANWDLPTLAGAGAIRSTAGDMLKFLSAELGLTKTDFASAIALSQKVHFETLKEGSDEGLAWVINRNNHVIWHNGQTGGYHSFAGFSVEKRAGVVVLSNTASMYSDALGFRTLALLSGGTVEPLRLPVPVTVEAADIEPLAGKYKLSDQVTVVVSREANRLFVQLTGQPKLRFFPESKTRFFCRAVEAAVSFEMGDDGSVKGLVIHQGGQNVPAARQP